MIQAQIMFIHLERGATQWYPMGFAFSVREASKG